MRPFSSDKFFSALVLLWGVVLGRLIDGSLLVAVLLAVGSWFFFDLVGFAALKVRDWWRRQHRIEVMSPGGTVIRVDLPRRITNTELTAVLDRVSDMLDGRT